MGPRIICPQLVTGTLVKLAVLGYKQSIYSFFCDYTLTLNNQQIKDHHLCPCIICLTGRSFTSFQKIQKNELLMSLLNLPHQKKFYSMPFPIKEKKALLYVLACPTCTQKKFLPQNSALPWKFQSMKATLTLIYKYCTVYP